MLLLPGGSPDSLDPTTPIGLSYLRMLPFEAQLRRRTSRPGVAVATLRYDVRGWNGAEQSPVGNTRRALGVLRQRLPDVPVILLGHSMGGRAAMRAAADPGVSGVVALAPWLSDREPVEQLVGTRVVIYHGTSDRMTDPAASRDFAERAARRGVDIAFVPLPGLEHTMLRSFLGWQRLAVRTTIALADPRVTAAQAAGGGASAG